MRNISTAWTKVCKTPEEKDNLILTLRNSTAQFGHLRRILQDLWDENERAEYNLKDFDKPGWAERQAFRNGYKSVLMRIFELTDFIEGPNK